MSLREQGTLSQISRRRDRMVRQAEARLEDALSSAKRRLLARAQVEATAAASEASSASTVRLFTVEDAERWWHEALTAEVDDAIRVVWRIGYFDTRDGTLTEEARKRMDEHVKLVHERLLAPTPNMLVDRLTEALQQERELGSTTGQIARRLSAETSWEPDIAYWQARAEQLRQQEADDRRVITAATRRGAIKDSHTAKVKLTRSRWQVQATMEAATHTTGTFNVGSKSAAVDENAGVKLWVATPDDITRPTHLDASGQCVPLDSFFTVGGALLEDPGDPDGPPEEVYNCRCTEVYADTCDEADSLYSEVGSQIEEEKQHRIEIEEEKLSAV